MTHCREGLLRAYADGALAPAAHGRVARHLAACPACRSALAEVASQAAWAEARLAPRPAAAWSGDEAAADGVWRRLRSVWLDGGARAAPATPGAGMAGAAAPEGPGAPARRRSRQPLLGPSVAGTIAAACAAAMALSPVRAFAGDFLQLFRVQNFQVVNVSQTDLAAISKALQSSGAAIDIRGLVNVRVSPNAGPQTVSLAQASGDVGFPVLSVQDPPAGDTLQSVQVAPAMKVEFNRLNVPALQQLLTSLGSTQTLPSGLNGASAQLQLPPAALLSYGGTGGAPPFQVLETGNPSLAVSTDGVNIGAVRNVLLGLPFLPADLRAQLAAVGDWENTALIPDVPGLSQPVTVAGAPGVFLDLGGGVNPGGLLARHSQAAAGSPGTAAGSAPAPGAGQTALLWMRGQTVYAVEGALTQNEAMALAQNLG